jgi:hypothetical protein
LLYLSATCCFRSWEDVQRFGLKARHLRKHRSRVDHFYRDMITGKVSARDTTARYRKRFERYKDSLFSFIEDDGVPWHNNTAERALRHLAVQRKISGSFSEKGATDYLRLLAIAQTCRFQGKSFLGFLPVEIYKRRRIQRTEQSASGLGSRPRGKRTARTALGTPAESTRQNYRHPRAPRLAPTKWE